MGYFLRTTAGLKGPIAPERLRQLIDSGKLTEDNHVLDADGTKHRLGDLLTPQDDFTDLLAGGEIEIDPSMLSPEPAMPPPPMDAPPALPGQPPQPPPLHAPPVHEPAAPPRSAPRRGVGAGISGRGRESSRSVSSRGHATGGRSRRNVAGRPMPHKLGWMTVSVMIVAIAYFLLAALFLVLGGTIGAELGPGDEGLTGFILAYTTVLVGTCAAIGSLLLWLYSGLNRRSSVAYGAAIVVGVLCCFSFFLPLGIFILIGASDAGTKAQFSPRY